MERRWRSPAGIEPVWEAPGQVGEVGAGEGPAQVNVRGFGLRHQQVAAQGVGEHVRVLGDDAD